MGNAKVILGNECPHCGAIWGLTEMEWNECDACGYPEPDEYNWGFEDDASYDEDDDEEMCEVEKF